MAKKKMPASLLAHFKSMKKKSKKTIRKKGKKPITFKQGGLHQSLGIKAGNKIPASDFAAALAGKKGPLAKKQALFKKNVLTGRKKKGR